MWGGFGGFGQGWRGQNRGGFRGGRGGMYQNRGGMRPQMWNNRMGNPGYGNMGYGMMNNMNNHPRGGVQQRPSTPPMGQPGMNYAAAVKVRLFKKGQSQK